jgi:phosphomannomutase
MINKSIFKAYDIRGVYPSEINEEAVYNIGRAAVTAFDAKTIAIGRDARESSPALFAELSRGIMDAGCNVIDLGILTTPMVYFAAWKVPEADMVISVTASHNPPQYNGMKFALKNAVPVGENSGLNDIRDLALAGEFEAVTQKGTLSTQDIKPQYYDYFASFANFGDKQFTIVVDTANAMGVLELEVYKRFPNNLKLITLYDDLEHPFSAHEANPLRLDTLEELQKKMVETQADLGIAYDGDADRVGFVDETGEIIPMDFATGMLAKELLRKNTGATILYDLRSSKAVKEIIEENGGVARECKVGHSNIKKQMREDGALFAGELSGHYYFQENSFAEAGSLASVILLNLMTETGQKISEIAQDLKRYFHSGEINSEVADKDAVLVTLKEKYADGAMHELDGLKVTYPTWWFNVRPSNTEPLLRLNMEADTKELMEEKRDELLAIIRG